MSNFSSKVGDDVSQSGVGSMVYLNVNDITVSSDYGSSTTSSNRQSLTPIESSFTELQQHSRNSVIIDRNILLAKDFYPIYQNNNDKDNSPESLSQLSKWSSLKNSAKNILPCYKSPTNSNSNEKTFSLLSVLFNIFPILKWLTNYSIRDNLMYDVIAGVTILALHIPQGLGK